MTTRDSNILFRPISPWILTPGTYCDIIYIAATPINVFKRPNVNRLTGNAINFKIGTAIQLASNIAKANKPKAW